MSDKPWYETLITNTPLVIIIAGVFLVVVGANKGLPYLQLVTAR
jgi:hypothetical protein